MPNTSDHKHEPYLTKRGIFCVVCDKKMEPKPPSDEVKDEECPYCHEMFPGLDALDDHLDEMCPKEIEPDE